MLLNDKKNDIRVYGVMVYTASHEVGVYLLNTGVIRYAMSKYDEKADLTNEEVYITNVSVFERKHPGKDFSEVTEIIEMEKTFFDKLKGIVKTIFTEPTYTFEKGTKGGFIIFGLDIIVDASGNIFVLEVNHHPYTYESEGQQKQIPPEGIAIQRLFGGKFYDYVFGSILKNKIEKNDRNDKYLKYILTS